MTKPINYEQLNRLKAELDCSVKEHLYLRVKGHGEDAEVAVVHGRFWTIIAAIASWFGYHAYNLQDITTVFQKELEGVQHLYSEAETENTLTEIHTTNCALTKFFEKELNKKDMSIANFHLNEEDNKEAIVGIQRLTTELDRLYENKIKELTQEKAVSGKKLSELKKKITEARKPQPEEPLIQAVFDKVASEIDNLVAREPENISSAEVVSLVKQAESLLAVEDKEAQQEKQVVWLLEAKALLSQAREFIEAEDKKEEYIGKINKLERLLERGAESLSLDKIKELRVEIFNELRELAAGWGDFTSLWKELDALAQSISFLQPPLVAYFEQGFESFSTAVLEAMQVEAPELEASKPLDEKIEVLFNFFKIDEFQGKYPAFLGQMEHLTEDIRGSIDYEQKSGSLASGVYATIYRHMSFVDKEMPTFSSDNERRVWIDNFCQAASGFAEARTLIDSFGGKEVAALDQMQCKRATLLMELRSFLLKAEHYIVESLPLDKQGEFKTEATSLWARIGGEYSFIGEERGFSKERLNSVTEEELKGIQQQMDKVFGRLLQKHWGKDIFYPETEEVATKKLASLQKEFSKHLKQLYGFQETGVGKLRMELEKLLRPKEGIKSRYKENHSLAKAVYKRIKKELRKAKKGEFSLIEPHFREGQMLAMAEIENNEQAKRAVLLMELRELLRLVKTDVEQLSPHKRNKLEHIGPEQIKTLSRRLFNEKGLVDLEEKAFSEKRLQSVSKDEVESLKKELIEGIKKELPFKERSPLIARSRELERHYDEFFPK